MFILSRKALRAFWERHPPARQPLEDWYTVAEGARWQNLAETREDFRHADPVGDCTVFNIGGNKYRLVVKITSKAENFHQSSVDACRIRQRGLERRLWRISN